MILTYLVFAGPQPACLDAADSDDNGRVNISDGLAVLFSLFRGSGPLPLPGPEVAWFDPTQDLLSCE